MGSVASTSNGLSDLLQTLTNENSPLLSTLSSPAIQAALQNAPASDIVQISDQAMQLQDAEALFGTPATASTPTDSLFAALTPAGSSAASPAPGASLADQLAEYQGNIQTQEAQTLLGVTPAPTTANSLYDVFA
jgi:hypothetical protein